MRTFPRSFRRALLWGLALLSSACTDSYLPDVIKTPPNYLVVDGFINTQGVTTVKLSRTAAIGSAAAVPPETRAGVYIEEEGGPRYLLTEGVKGTYTSAALTLNPTRNYRLHLNTLAGKDYASDFVPAKTTPPIDEVRWQLENTGLNVYVSAHDAANATRYYRWEYIETWEIFPPYQPTIEYVNKILRTIVVPFPRLCWGNAPSAGVQIDKTTTLSQDVVADYRLRVLSPTSERLYTRYSILVRQHALTKDEYAYWELLRKNTESIGTLFDPQPAQLTGNVHCLSTANELVLGYVGAHSTTEKRLFIGRTELPRSLNVRSGYEACLPPDTVLLFPRGVVPPPKPADIIDAAFSDPKRLLPIEYVRDGNGNGVGVTGKSPDCVDCRLRGTSVKPSFWP